MWSARKRKKHKEYEVKLVNEIEDIVELPLLKTWKILFILLNLALKALNNAGHVWT